MREPSSVSFTTRISDSDILLGQKGGGGGAKRGLVISADGENSKNKPSLFSVCDFKPVCQVLVLYAFCCFLPSRSPAMGNLIKVLGKDLENCPHFFLDFESK